MQGRQRRGREERRRSIDDVALAPQRPSRAATHLENLLFDLQLSDEASLSTAFDIGASLRRTMFAGKVSKSSAWRIAWTVSSTDKSCGDSTGGSRSEGEGSSKASNGRKSDRGDEVASSHWWW